MIEVRSLTKRYGPFTAVDDVSFSIEGAGIVGFLGPNGAGKTTTMRMLTGFLPMTEGTAVVAGHDVFESPQQVKARVGYLPETPPLYPELSVGEYLRFVAEIKGVPRADRLRRVGQVMEQVGLAGMEARLTGSLSKGYRQRVGLAQALVHDPRVIILDEPTSGLDPAQLVGIRRLIKELATERTVVLSTHILPEVEMLCDRVLLIHKGKLVGDGTVEALAQQVGGGDWVELRLSGAPDDVQARLTALDSVSSVAELPEDGAIARWKLRGTPALVPEVGALAVSAGWTLMGLSPRRASLQEVFLELVGVEG